MLGRTMLRVGPGRRFRIEILLTAKRKVCVQLVEMEQQGKTTIQRTIRILEPELNSLFQHIQNTLAKIHEETLPDYSFQEYHATSTAETSSSTDKPTSTPDTTNQNNPPT